MLVRMATIHRPKASDHMTLNLEHPTSAHVRLFMVLECSDHISLNLEHPTTAHARLFIVLESSGHKS
jgi:hypothetical protein